MIPGGLLGPVGDLRHVMFTTAEPMRKPTRYVTRRTLAGGTRKQVLARPPRTWVCEIEHDAPQEGQIVDQNEYWVASQRQQVVWYPADALGTNMLDPEASLMDTGRWTRISPGGARVLPLDHDAPRFMSSAATFEDGTWAHLSDIPVPHGSTVTASVQVVPYEGQSAYFWVDELAIDGETIRVHKTNTTKALNRLVHTFETLPNTVALTFGVSRAAGVALPCLTLTDRLMPWGVGRGCMAATVEVTSRDPLWTAAGPGVYTAADRTAFSVEEIIP